MYIKMVSLVLATCVAELFAYGLQAPSDPMFLFISNSPAVVLLRLLLAAVLVFIAFRGRFNHRESRSAAKVIGIALACLGIVGMYSQPIINFFSDYIKVCDFMLMVSFGLALVIASLTLPTRQRSLYSKKSRLYRLQHFLAIKFSNPKQQKSAF